MAGARRAYRRCKCNNREPGLTVGEIRWNSVNRQVIKIMERTVAEFSHILPLSWPLGRGGSHVHWVLVIW